MLHSDNTADYYTHTLSALAQGDGGATASATMNQLNVILVYGIGSLILIVLPIFVIALYEMREVKKSQSGGLDPLMGAIIRMFLYSLFFLIFITLFMMLLSGLSTSSVNPAYGIYFFFTTDWLDLSVMQSLANITSITADPNKKAAAESIIAILALIRFVYIIILMIFWLVMFSFATTLVSSEHKKGNGDDNTASYVIGLFLASVFSTLTFWTLIWMMGTSLNSIIYFATTIVHTNTTNLPTEINLVNDVVALFNIGAETFANSL